MTDIVRPALLAMILLAATVPVHAAIEEQWDPELAGPPETTWYVAANPAALQADRDYVAGMRPHHAGALTMSREYLADPAASSPVLRDLARAIIRNQEFEIALLDAVASNLARPPIVLDLGLFAIRMQPAASEGLAFRTRFLRSPIPSLLNAVADPAARVTTRDVAFAKGMSVHHQPAVEMARAYHANPAARNGFLGLLNIDIERDQVQEIDLMRRVVRQYAGNPDEVVVDPMSVHGMEGMGHGPGVGNAVKSEIQQGATGHAEHSTPHAATTPVPRSRPSVRRRAAEATGHEGHQH